MIYNSQINNFVLALSGSPFQNCTFCADSNLGQVIQLQTMKRTPDFDLDCAFHCQKLKCTPSCSAVMQLENPVWLMKDQTPAFSVTFFRVEQEQSEVPMPPPTRFTRKQFLSIRNENIMFKAN